MSAFVDGSITVKEARESELEDPIARVTGLSTRTIRAKLSSAHGAMLLCNVFDQWPRRVDEIGAWSAAFARERDVSGEVASFTGIGVRVVRRRLDESPGNMLVQNVFGEDWPGVPRTRADLFEMVDGMNVAAVAGDPALHEGLARGLGLSVATVRRRLAAVHGASLVRSVFRDEWPTEREEPHERRASSARSTTVAGTADGGQATSLAGPDSAGPIDSASAPPRSSMFRRYDLKLARATRARREPAPHQAEALVKLHEWYRSRPKSHRGGILVLPTGGGKTFTSVRFLCQEPLSDGYKVLWLAHTHHLLEQAIEAFGPVDAAADVPLEVAHIAEPARQLDVRVVSATPGHFPVSTISPSDDVVIATLQTVVGAHQRHHEKLASFLEAADGKLIVVFDEAHHAPAPSYCKFLEEMREAHPEMYLLGLTATPTYSDERRKGWLKNLFPQDVLSTVSRSRLIAAGVLSKPHFENARTNVTVELDEPDYQRWLSSYGDLPEEIVSTLAKNQVRNDFIADTYITARERYGKTLIFADRWYQCDYLREALRRRGVRADVVYSHVDAKLATADERNRRAKDENARVLHQFRNDEIDVLINVRMLTEGTDVPSVKSVFLTRQTTSSILLTQMIGRALRGPRFGGTEDAHIVSFIDNWKQVIAFADYEALPVGQADDATPEYGKRPPLQLISIELVRRLARQMNTGGGGSVAPFVTLLPVGWYRVEFQTRAGGGDDIAWARQLVMVFANEKSRYDGFIGSLAASDVAAYAAEDITLDTRREELERWRDKFFTSSDDHPGTDLLLDLFHIVRHMAQGVGAAPLFFRFEERSSHDVDAIAKDCVQRDLGPRALDEALMAEYTRIDRFWRSLYSTYGLFYAQYQSAQRRLLDAARHGADVERYSGAVSTPERPPMREASEAVRDAVFRRDGGRCCCCGATRQLQLDHVVPFYLGGSTDMDQLQTLCRVCNGNKSINEINFRVSRTPLDGPPTLTLLALPADADPADQSTWVEYVRRTINFFYRCAAVDTVALGTATEVRLCPGLDPAWIDPHLPNLTTHVGETRRNAGLTSMGRFRVTTTQ